MAVPRNRLSNSRKNTKRSHHAKKALSFNACVNCKAPTKPHHICISCGHYKGRVYKSEETA